MIISQSRKFVFVHLHKTAGEAVTLALLPYLGRGDLVLGATTLGNLRNLRQSRRLGISKHSSARALRAHLGAETWEGFFTFSFVRHPFDRVRSLYAYLGLMTVRRQNPSLRGLLYGLPLLKRGDPLTWPGVKAYLGTQDFSGFIRHPQFRADPGSACQYDLLADGAGGLLVDFVGHFDRLETDFAQVTDRLGLADVTLPRHNSSQEFDTGDTDLSEEDRQMLGNLYRKDFEAFGFSTDWPARSSPAQASEALAGT